jgi:hypothetical protein
VQAYSHMPHPVHLLGSAETNFLSVNFCGAMGSYASCSKYLNLSQRGEPNICRNCHPEFRIFKGSEEVIATSQD